jgi:hypothetical protein
MDYFDLLNVSLSFSEVGTDISSWLYFCRKLTCCFAREKYIRASPITLIAWKLLRTRAKEKKQRHKLNTAVYRIFCDDGALHQGYICGFDTKEGYYKIKYQDGDIKEATEEEIDRMLKKPNKTAMVRALSATRFDRIHEQYSKTQSRMPVASKFSNGFGKAVAILDFLGGKEDAFIPDKQEYKYRAEAVIDEETGKSMEYKDLLKDPKYREDWSRAAANKFGRLFNGAGKNKDGTQRVIGTNTCHWIKRSQVLKGKKSNLCPNCSSN